MKRSPFHASMLFLTCWYLLIIAVNVAFAGGIIYVAWHFISKFW